MLTLNTILEEVKNVPVNRLKDLYSIIHSFQTNTKKSGNRNKKIMSFAGSFGEMKDDDFMSFLNHTKQTRKNLFDRDFDL